MLPLSTWTLRPSSAMIKMRLRSGSGIKACVGGWARSECGFIMISRNGVHHLVDHHTMALSTMASNHPITQSIDASDLSTSRPFNQTAGPFDRLINQSTHTQVRSINKSIVP